MGGAVVAAGFGFPLEEARAVEVEVGRAVPLVRASRMAVMDLTAESSS